MMKVLELWCLPESHCAALQWTFDRRKFVETGTSSDDLTPCNPFISLTNCSSTSRGRSGEREGKGKGGDVDSTHLDPG